MPQTLLSLIGNTPLVELKRLAPRPGIRLFAKLEGQNPSGSIKDRIVLAIIEAAESRGDLKPGDTIVDATSGNTGIALAMIGKQKGYRVCLAIPRGVAPSIIDILEYYGVEVVWCEPKGGMASAVFTARDIAAERGYYPLRQFSDPQSVEAHYRGTAEEVLRDLPQVDVFVAGIGTSGTIMGVGRRLREANPAVKVIGVDPRMGDRLQGLIDLSEGFAPPLLDLSRLDGRFLVDAATAMEHARLVAHLEGIMAGVSAGAALYAALRYSRRIDSGNIVVMFADGAWKYLPARPWEAAQQKLASLDDLHWW
jgi:cysteine synthase B